MEDARDKLLLQLTGQEFIDLLREGLALSAFGYEEQKPEVKKHFVYGLSGLSKLLGVCKSTACKIKNSGILDPAICQNGKVIVIDADLAIELLKVRKKKR